MKPLSAVRTWVAVAALCAVPSAAFAQQQQYGNTGGPNTYITWGTNNIVGNSIDVTYFIGSGFTANQANLIRQAAATWSNASMAMNLVEVGSVAASDIRLDAAPIAAFTLSNVTLNGGPGAGTYPNGTPWIQLNVATAVVNSNFSFWDGTGVQGAMQIDFEAYALMLLGRTLGLGFAAPGDTTSVMQRDSGFSFGIPGNQTLAPGDVVAINAVYGTPEPATLALFGIGLLAFSLSRKSRRAPR